MAKRYYIMANGGYSVGKAYGARFLFDWRHPIDKKVALELYEYGRIKYLLKILDRLRPDMFLDIGAHAALYSLILKTRYPDIEVHAFEPDRTNLCQLYANLFVNKLQNKILVHEHGISDKDGKVMFDVSEETTGRGTRHISSSGSIEIDVKRLDNVLADKGRIVAVKIDVEGHECQVVDGASELLGSNQCFVQVESAPENFALLTQKLNALGYRLVTTISDHFFTNIVSVSESV